MRWSLAEIKKHGSINFDEELDLKASLQKRDEDILDISPVRVVGSVSYEDNLYLLIYQATYDITLPSTRSLEPVSLPTKIEVTETFADSRITDEMLGQDENILTLDSDAIDLNESVMDNIIIEIPSRVLSKDEEESDELPSGKDWKIMSEEDYNKAKEADKEAKSPFASLDGLFD
jgi:Predicted metal-binding, possibly nucleic acid-binding protein